MSSTKAVSAKGKLPPPNKKGQNMASRGRTVYVRQSEEVAAGVAIGKWAIGIIGVVMAGLLTTALIWSMSATTRNSTDIAVMQQGASAYVKHEDVGKLQESIMGLQKDVEQISEEQADLKDTTKKLVEAQNSTLRNQERMQIVLEDIRARSSNVRDLGLKDYEPAPIIDQPN